MIIKKQNKPREGEMSKLKDWWENFKYLLTGYYTGHYKGKKGQPK